MTNKEYAAAVADVAENFSPEQRRVAGIGIKKSLAALVLKWCGLPARAARAMGIEYRTVAPLTDSPGLSGR